MTLQDAIRARNGTLERMMRPADRDALIFELAKAHGDYQRYGSRALPDVARLLSETLRAPLYHSAANIEALIWQAGQSLPDTTLRNELLPTPNGTWIFTDACDLGTEDESSGVSWLTGPNGIYASVLWVLPKVSALIPITTFSWRFGISVAANLARLHKLHAARRKYELITNADKHMIFLLCASLFVKQRILTIATERPDRAMRKWAARIDLPDSDIRIVQLRQKQYERKDGAPEERDWSCHWLVRGHWRAQYHSSTDTHEPIWILPHLKGDFDKPFKPPTETVFAVTR